MTKKTNFAALLLMGLLFILVGCAIEPDVETAVTAPTASSSEDSAAVPPEPTNTPAPEVATVPAGEPCSVGGQQQQIDAAFATYQAAREGDPLLTLTDWVNETTAEIASVCLADNFELTEPDELAGLLEKLQEGGYVVYVRHTHTDRSRGDTDVSFGNCDLQRILSERGRDEALMMRNAYQVLDLPVSLLISTQYCRTVETAVLAFGVPRLILRTDLHATLPEWLGTEPEPGTNIFIVAHIGTIRDRVGLDDTFEEGDSLIYRPTGDGEFEFVGRIGLYDWPVMAAMQAGE